MTAVSWIGFRRAGARDSQAAAHLEGGRSTVEQVVGLSNTPVAHMAWFSPS